MMRKIWSVKQVYVKNEDVRVVASTVSPDENDLWGWSGASGGRANSCIFSYLKFTLECELSLHASLAVHRWGWLHTSPLAPPLVHTARFKHPNLHSSHHTSCSLHQRFPVPATLISTSSCRPLSHGNSHLNASKESQSISFQYSSQLLPGAKPYPFQLPQYIIFPGSPSTSLLHSDTKHRRYSTASTTSVVSSGSSGWFRNQSLSSRLINFIPIVVWPNCPNNIGAIV